MSAGSTTTKRRSGAQHRPLWIGAAALAVLPFAMPAAGLTIDTAAVVVIFAIAAMGLNMLVGYTGLTSFGHSTWFGIGGYAGGPVTLAAAVLGRRTVILEPNAHPGFTNRVLRPFVGRAACAYEDARSWFGPKGVATMTFSLLVLSAHITSGTRIFNLAALTVFCSMEIAGERPSMESTSGLSICSRNCRA